MTHGTDTSAYLKRIGYDGSIAPTLDTLAGLIAAHESAIPFENLTPLMGIPVDDLSAEALFDKMVHRNRGGYCYEQNGLLRYVLTDLGFEVDALGARVVWMRPGGSLPAQTHQLLSVRIPGDDQRYLADVGFGGQTLTSPVRFVADAEQQTRHEPYRVRSAGTDFMLEARIHGEWRPLYVFADQVRPQIDLEVGSWYVSTHPTSMFVTSLAASIVTDDSRCNLGGRHLTVHHRDGHSEKTEFANASQVLDVLMNRFGIDVGGLGDVHKRITEVLDA